MSILYCPEQASMGARSSSAKIWGWAVCTEVLKWFNYPHARAHPGCEVSYHGTEWACIVGLSMIRRGQPNSGESCIMLQIGPTRSLVAKFLQHSVVACSMQISCCRGRTLQMRPRTGVCEPLMPDVVLPKVHQNNCSYVSSADLPSDSLRENSILHGGRFIHGELWKYKCMAFVRVWAFARDNTVCPHGHLIVVWGFDWRQCPTSQEFDYLRLHS